MTRRLLVSAACAVGFVAPARAAITAFWQQNFINFIAVLNDPRLATHQSWDLIVTTDGNWASGGLRAVLPSVEFYNNVFGGNTKPNVIFLRLAPALEFDTYVTAPADNGAVGAPSILGGFPESQPLSMSGDTISVSWGDLVNDPPGTHQIARLTFQDRKSTRLNSS